jgi:hypothetical protein
MTKQNFHPMSLRLRKEDLEHLSVVREFARRETPWAGKTYSIRRALEIAAGVIQTQGR